MTRVVESLSPAGPRYGPDGLMPVIVQDAADGRVLMLAYTDAEALTATVATGEVHFHSRSRDRLWRKGETSGNTLAVRGLALDCDGDALLVSVDPAGPTCHRGTRSCFDLQDAGVPGASDAATASTAGTTASSAGATPQGFAWLETLWATIADRVADRPEGSYTARLIDGGTDAVSRKVTEEATEVLLAAKDDAAAESPGADRDATRAALADEAADLLYHTLVLLAERELPPAAVIGALRSRHRPDRS